MKTTRLLVLTLAVWTLGAKILLAQFNSGSTGADGALNVTVNTTLNLPASGVFHFTTINVSTGATLRFSPNALNTPVHLLATGDVTIAGIIDVSGDDPPSSIGPPGGRGGPGGFKGGEPGVTSSAIPPGAGQGPGAGRAQNGSTPETAAGHAAFGGPAFTISGNNGSVYGTPLLIPLIGGSGGGGNMGNPGFAGGGGGGAILIASNTRIQVTGHRQPRGQSCPNDRQCDFRHQRADRSPGVYALTFPLLLPKARGARYLPEFTDSLSPVH